MPETGDILMFLLTVAWLLPLAGFVVEIYWLCFSHRLNKGAAYCAVACIGLGFLCSFSALMYWGTQTNWAALSEPEHHGHDASHDGGHGEGEHPQEANAAEAEHPGHTQSPAQTSTTTKKYFSGTYYELARFGALRVSLDWYIDSLTLVMFTMVTFIATCIHIFAIGYMHDELTEEYEDHEVHLHNGGHFSRPGRFHRFFAYLSLFSFSMLGIVLAGNLFQVFIFWELVGLSSYLLIGFYIER
ncbi:MAG: NADH-quinone oxidoreductase subunit L, partial [Gemmataceae bacterium]